MQVKRCVRGESSHTCVFSFLGLVVAHALVCAPPPASVMFASVLGLNLTVDLHCLIFVVPESGVVCAI